MKFGADIHVPPRINCDNFGVPLTFHLAPSSGQNLSPTLVYDQIPQMYFVLVLISKCKHANTLN